MRARLLLVLTFAAGACGDHAKEELPWGIGIATFDAADVGIASADLTPAPPWFAAIEDRAHVETPTYDGNNQATHPDVLVEPDRALLALTPYPFSNNRFENPSLLQADDGLGFAAFPGAPSPLVPAPPVDHNDDPDLRRDPATGEYELLYLDTERPDHQTMVALRSLDLVTWTRRDAIVWNLAAGDEFIVSPTAIVDAATGVTRLFFVNAATNVIETLASADGITWDKAAVQPVALPMNGVLPWHIDVLRAGAGYAMLISGFDSEFVHQDLYLALSPDLDTWALASNAPLLSHQTLGLSTLYRSTGAVAGGRFVVWYAMQYFP